MLLQDPHASRRSRMISYHNLAWSLVDADPTQCDASWANPIQRAIWLKALRADGNFYEATDLTPDLAKWKYFCNLVAILQALLDKDQDTDGVHPDDFERVARVHEKALSLGRPTSFNMIYEMQQYASSLAFNQTQEAKVFVDPDFKWITIGVETMHLDKLREGIQHLAQDMKSRYRALTQSNNVMTKMPDQVKDDLTNTTRGYSFISENPFFEKRHSLLLFLVEQYNLAMVDNAGRIAWNIPAVKELLRRTLRIWEPAYHLLYITTHISSRGTQFIDHQISNADRHRNLFMQGAEMFLLTGYSKKTSITDRDSCTPGFVPKDIAFWILEFLGGGLRTAEAILAGIVYGKDAEHLYRTYLCVGDGKRISPARFSANVQHMNYEYFECRWGLRDFRQGTITMGREFISPNESYAEADSILAESADHSTNTDHAHYGIVHGSVPRLSNNTIIQQRWVSNEWHIFLGLGSSPPQQPVRLRRAEIARATRGVDFESISDQVVKTMTGVLTSFFNDDIKTLIQHAVSASLQEHQKSNDPTGLSLSSGWAPPAMDLEFNTSDLFFQDGTGNATAAKSPRSELGRLLSDSPLPPSSAAAVSHLISPDLLLPDPGPSPDIVPTSDQEEMFTVRKSKGTAGAYDVGQPPPATPAPMANASLPSDLGELPAVRAWKGKARAIDADQSSPTTATAKWKATAHAFDQPPSFTTVMNSSKGRSRAQAIEHPPPFTLAGKHGPSRTVVNASKAKARDESIKQPHSTASALSSSPAVATAVHAFDRPPSFASIIDPSTGKAKVQAVESLFTPTGKPGPSRTIAYASKGKARDVSITQAHSSVLSLSSSPAVAPMAYRKHHRPQHISEPDDDDEEAPRKLKRLRRPSTAAPDVQMETISLTSDDDLSSFIVPDSGLSSSPPPVVQEMRNSIRGAIRQIMKDPTAAEKSRDQMDALVAIMTETHDLVITMKTGGGKSMLWMVPPVLDEAEKCIVVCPFVALLQEQYMKTAATGLRCHDYTARKDVPENVQVLFVQVENCSSQAFASLLVSPLGKKFTRFYVDEFHDVLNCHPDRASKWLTLARQFSAASVQMILMSGTIPPHRVGSYVKPFGILLHDINEVRFATNRPEIGMHVARVEPIAARESLHHLVHTLSLLLGDEDRMLVFFSSTAETEEFGRKARCAMYHSELWQPGNTKAYNLDLWDRGESKVMACTTAFAQGMDRSNVRYVVIFRPAYGLIVNNQMMGRAGRDGRESHVFYVTDKHGKSLPSKAKHASDHCLAELDDVMFGTECRRYTNGLCMDGEQLALRCTDPPRGVPCDICAPNSAMQLLIRKALDNPFRELDAPVQTSSAAVGSGSASQDGPSAAQPMPPAFVQVGSSLQMPTDVSPSTQNSDSLYDL
ncbi:uncharacterized protein EDB91DRAFT_1090004 [Suillus paluster]|uniref:uncharacterized protein n=1 Tax=Suillus paluster TaxID=48578 RepID=UPI001B867A72|nr:uncharacterized protein EDB91DRAFT_1090004 [Suillus paluster]KAG1718527.1 hypothetical protein EDB91DRAFT_1090004 [Suillus paluster]